MTTTPPPDNASSDTSPFTAPLAGLAAELCDLWQTHLTSLAHDPQAKADLARLFEPQRQFMAQAMTQGMAAYTAVTTPPSSAPSSGAPHHAPETHTPSQPAAPTESSAARTETSATASDDGALRMAQFAYRLAALERRIDQLERQWAVGRKRRADAIEDET